MPKLPRKGQYELFTLRGWTHCFDDPTFEKIRTPDGMFDWIRSHDKSLWREMKEPNGLYTQNDVLYLQPQLYLLWKLKWA